MRVAIRRLSHARMPTELPMPIRASAGAAGFDLHAAVTEPSIVAPGERVRVPTGLVMALPPGYEGQVRPRSGRAWADGLTVLNAPGTIDSDYRGELLVLLVNLGQRAVTISRGDRIAQLVVAPVLQVEFDEVEALDETGRGEGGFGHSGA